MALAIDTTRLAQRCIPRLQWILDNLVEDKSRCFQVYRVCAHATIVHDASTARRLQKAGGHRLVEQEALEWQADPDDDLDDVEVLTHLNHQAKSSPVFAELALSQTDATTTLVTSCAVQSPSRAQGSRPLSSFHRYYYRRSILCISDNYSIGQWWRRGWRGLPEVILTAQEHLRYRWSDLYSNLKIVGASSRGNRPAVVWQLQFDVVDVLSPRTLPTSRPGKRRRTTLNPFHQVSSAPLQDSSRKLHHLLEPKRFKGVRYRPDHRMWVAEMKPPKYKNKVPFGEFKSQAQAARVVDAAFHYYEKPHLLNFSDTAHILSTRPMSPAALGEKDKLSFVKEQAKWMASMASTLPSPPPSAPYQIPESLSRGCTGEPLGFRSFSDIASFLSCGDADEVDDAISQRQHSLHADPGAGSRA